MKSDNLVLVALGGVALYFIFGQKKGSSPKAIKSSSATAPANFKAPAPKIPGVSGNLAQDIANYANTGIKVAGAATDLFNKWFGSSGNDAFNGSPYTSGGDQNFDFFAGSGTAAGNSGVDDVPDFSDVA